MIAALLARLAPWVKWWPVVVAVAAFATGWTLNGWRWEARHASELQEQIDARAAQERVAQKVSTELEQKLTTMQSQNRELNRRLAHETTNPAYACRVPVSGVQLLNEAVVGKPTSQPNNTVP